MIYVSEGLLYVCFAILTGSLLLKLVPENRRPSIQVPNGLLLACAIAIPIFSYVPIHNLALVFGKDFDMSYGSILKSILLDINTGKAWLWTAIGSAGLALLLGLKAFRNDKHMPKVALFVTFLLIVWLGYAGHASSLYGFRGLITHSSHFLAVSVWIGILFVVSWFAKDNANWPAFLRWFSPVAIAAVVVTLLAGIILMTFTTPEYVNAWMLPYGQMLLIKHLLILPLLLFAYSNGFGYKKAVKNHADFNPKRWLRAESLIALLVLAATGVLGQQTPPHIVKETLQTVSPSPLFTTIYKGSFSPDIALHFNLQLESLLMFAAALLMAGGLLWMYRTNKLIPAFLMGILTAVFGYYGLMFAIA
ncbi:putative copper resistance protein D [Paenibacillus endophyticus]|uniref:Putative copper resistance protein D n=1 Tax=Paenibacillus endophyticus TaxID=1294268 RepID=A0A7W5C2V7_9BACL|nr:CopD family protein [Paenibacillus endophyticus]MBB3150226.1 putative copper resistance protein D [Paenibacillus endophyticus]